MQALLILVKRIRAELIQIVEFLLDLIQADEPVELLADGFVGAGLPVERDASVTDHTVIFKGVITDENSV